MEQPIIIRYRWTADELLTSSAVYRRKLLRPIFRIFSYFIICIAAISFCITLYSHQWVTSLICVVGLLCFITPPQYRRWLLRRQFQQRPDRDSICEWQISSENISISSHLGHAECAWESFSEVAQANEGFLLFNIPQVYHWIPRHGFQDFESFEAFTELAKSKVKKYQIVK